MTVDPDYTDLLQAAISARSHAYAPYSNFAVGAVALATSGRVYAGCNIENAAYGVSCCAERVALFNAYAHGERQIIALAVVADTEGPVSPCGVCRQALFELAPLAHVVLGNLRGMVLQISPQELLPIGFGPASLTGGGSG